MLDAGEVERFAAAVASRFGAADVLINNAGQGRVSTFADTTDDAWREELELKFFSIIRPTRAFLPQLERSNAAAIVCVNSLLARQPEPHMVATSAARAGVLNLVRSLATELAPRGMRVNGILIGLVESGQWRRRFETPGRARRDLGGVDRRARRTQGHPARPPRATGGSGARDGVPRLAARLVHHRHLHRRFRGTFPPCLAPSV